MLTSEVVLAFFFRLFGLQGMRLLVTAICVSSLSFGYWYWETGRFLKQTSRAQQMTVDFIQSTDAWFQRYFHSLVARGVVFSVVFLIGLAPVIWIGAIVFCEEKQSRVGLGLLFIGNIVKAVVGVASVTALLP